jgi:anti-sigma B factor antagonist
VQREVATAMLNQAKTSKNQQPGSTGFGISQSDLEGRTSVISVEGELDLSTAPRLKWMLIDSLEAGRNQLVVDLSLVNFMDSTALGVLVGIARKLDREDRLAIVCARANVLRIFEFAGLDGAFVIFSTADQALAHVRGRSAQAG